jgi:hypothetical protein
VPPQHKFKKRIKVLKNKSEEEDKEEVKKKQTSLFRV